MTPSSAGEGVTLALGRVVIGYRVVGVVWLWLLIAVALREPGARWTLIIGAGLLATVWTALTVSAAARAPVILRAPWFLALDIAATAVLIVLSATASPSRGFFGGYPFSTVLVAGFGAGYPGAFAAAFILSIVSLAQLGASEAINSSLVYLAGAGVTVWAFDVLRRNEVQRRALEQRLAAEEAERVRSQERADTAAALHDSVLQTLALIQRRSDDPAAVASLARRQERDLRDWLVQRGTVGGQAHRTLAAALKDAAAEIEQDYPITVNVVTVGDVELDEARAALVAAAREAIVNVAKHAGVDSAAVYAEVDESAVRVFVRDRGAGFDPAAVPADRRGISESIVGRVHRHGGEATVAASPGGGTEVQLTLPAAGVP